MKNLYSVSIEDFSTNPETFVLFEEVWSKEKAEEIIKEFISLNEDISGILISVIKNEEKYLDIDEEGNILE